MKKENTEVSGESRSAETVSVKIAICVAKTLERARQMAGRVQSSLTPPTPARAD